MPVKTKPVFPNRTILKSLFKVPVLPVLTALLVAACDGGSSDYDGTDSNIITQHQSNDGNGGTGDGTGGNGGSGGGTGGSGGSGGGGGGSGGGGGGGGGSDPIGFKLLRESPSNNAEIKNFPDEVRLYFSKNINTVGSGDIQLHSSGGDGNFSSGNETELLPNTISKSGNTVVLDFTGHSESGNESYRVSVKSSATFLDNDGKQLDSDGDGSAGPDTSFDFDTNTGSSTPTLTNIQNTIFTPTCATTNCHKGSSPRRNLNLESGNSFTDLVEVDSEQNSNLKRVEVGNAADSYLVRKIEGSGSSGAQMPKDDTPLSGSDIQKIKDWINAGAIDN